MTPNPERFVSAKMIKRFPIKAFPLLVLSDNLRSFISWGIKAHQHGNYNHMMWMHRPGFVISQGLTLKEEPIDHYLKGNHRLKFWSGKDWRDDEKRALCGKFTLMPQLPWYKRLYDPFQIIGKFFGIKWFQTPGLRICSDHADYLADLQVWETGRHLSPPEVNRRLKEIDGNYVFARYVPD